MRMERDIKVRVIDDCFDYIKIIPFERTNDGKTYNIHVPNGEGYWKSIEKRFGECVDDKEVLIINREWAEQIFNGLYEIFKPPIVNATTTELKATKYHLEDMRNLVFKEKIEGENNEKETKI